MVSKSLIDSYINHDKFVSVNNLLKEYSGIKEEIENPENAVGIHYINAMEMYFVTCKKDTANKIPSLGELDKVD